MNKQKRIIAINDISCFGKCSLTAALPILSAAGIETCVLPTALLSAHTAFSGFTFSELSSDLRSIMKHWKELNLEFDGIYSGYLGSKKQIELVEEIIDLFPSNMVLVDPVMGDNGRLYEGFDESFAVEMNRLLKKADIIVPNVTEASFLTCVPYEVNTHSQDYIETLIDKLKKQCPGKIVLTGINLSHNTVGTAVWDGIMLDIIERKKIDVFYSGTGDVFASTLTASYLLGNDIKKSAEISADYIIDCIYETQKTSGDRNYGINFELCIKNLLSALGII